MHVYSEGCRILGLLMHALSLPPHHILWMSLLPSPPCRGMQRHMILAEHGGDSWQCGLLIGRYRQILPELESESQGSCGCGHIQSCDPFSRDHLLPCCTLWELPRVWDAVWCSGLCLMQWYVLNCVRSEIRHFGEFWGPHRYSGETSLVIVPGLPSFSLWGGLFLTGETSSSQSDQFNHPLTSHLLGVERGWPLKIAIGFHSHLGHP